MFCQYTDVQQLHSMRHSNVTAMTQLDKDSQAVGRKVVWNLFDESKGTLHNHGLPNQLVFVSAEAKMRTKFGAAVTYPDEVVVRKQSQRNWGCVAASGTFTFVAQVYIKPCLAVCELWRKLGPALNNTSKSCRECKVNVSQWTSACP